MTQGSVVTPRRANDYPFLIGHYKKILSLNVTQGSVVKQKKGTYLFQIEIEVR